MTARRSASFVVFALAAIAASAAVDAQPAGKVRHIGFIASGSASTGRTLVDAFRVGLRDHGWIEGTNIVVDYRFAATGSSRARSPPSFRSSNPRSTIWS